MSNQKLSQKQSKKLRITLKRRKDELFTCSIICYRNTIKSKDYIIFPQHLVGFRKRINFADKYTSHIGAHTEVLSQLNVLCSLAWQSKGTESNIFSSFFHFRKKMFYYWDWYNIPTKRSDYWATERETAEIQRSLLMEAIQITNDNLVNEYTRTLLSIQEKQTCL